MTRGIDSNAEWLKTIGAVTVHDGDDADEFDDDSPPAVTPGEDFLAGTSDDRDVHDLDEVEPFGSAEDQYTESAGTLLLDSPLSGGVAAVDLDSGVTADSSQNTPPRRFTPWVLAAFGAVAVIGTVITLVVTMANSPSPEAAAPATAPVPPRVVEVAPPSPPPNVDGPLPFTASSDCPPGSTSAQSVGDPHSTTPWVCVESVPGQVLEIDLGRTFVITAVSIVPGAVNKTDTSPDQPDPWLQHRVVTRVQWQFNDTDRTVKNQNTGNVRGEAVEAIRPGVLASKITVIIQETSRPPVIAPTDSPAAPDPGAGPSIIGDILGGTQNSVAPVPVPVLPGARNPRDPADGSFAVSSIKIIGHKAV